MIIALLLLLLGRAHGSSNARKRLQEKTRLNEAPRIFKLEEFNSFSRALALLDGEIASLLEAWEHSRNHVRTYYPKQQVVAGESDVPKLMAELFQIQFKSRKPCKAYLSFPAVTKFLDENIFEKRVAGKSRDQIEELRLQTLKALFAKAHRGTIVSFWKLNTDLFQKSPDEVCFVTTVGGKEMIYYWRGRMKDERPDGPGIMVGEDGACVSGDFHAAVMQGLGIMRNGSRFWHGYFLDGFKWLAIKAVKGCILTWKKSAKRSKLETELKSLSFRRWNDFAIHSKKQELVKKEWELKWESLMEEILDFKEILKNFQQQKESERKNKVFQIWHGFTQGSFKDPKEF